MPEAEVIRIDHGRRTADTQLCRGRTAGGRPCRNRAGASGYCKRHEPVEQPATHSPSRFEADLERALAFLRRRVTGGYAVDDFGFDPDLTENVLLPILRPLFDRWWRVEQRGLDNIPATGPALLVSNHSGTLPWDALMMKLAVYEGTGRHCRLLAADLPFRLPVVGEIVGVFPEGYKGIGKPFHERYKLQRFGRGGFVEVALRTGAPMIPVSIVGAEEIYPMLYNLKPLARLLGFPYFPVTPTFPALGLLGALPLPSKWIIEYGEPIQTSAFTPDAALDPMFVFNLTDQVREAIQQTLYKNLMSRRSVFF